MKSGNPVFLRFCRAELRLKKALFWYLLTLVVSAFVTAIIYAPQTARGIDATKAAQGAFLGILVIQAIILLFMGTSAVAGGITREKVDNVLNYQRMTPLPTRIKILGYLFGLPVRQYIMFLLTVPFLIFTIRVGNIPLSAYGPYLALFFTSALLYHLTGFVAGMISRSWRWSFILSQGMVFLLYFVLPQLSAVGLIFLRFLTVWPAFDEKIRPALGVASPGYSPAVPFFATSVSASLFSLIVQVFLISLFLLMVARKWQSDSRPSVSKRMALVTFALFCLVSLGNTWPTLIRGDEALALFKPGGHLGPAAVPFAMPLLLAAATSALACFLMIPALPNPMQFRHGRLRAAKLGRRRLHWLEDSAGGYPFILLVIAIQAPVLIIGVLTLHRAGYLQTDAGLLPRLAILLCANAVFLLYMQALLEGFMRKSLAIFLLVAWVVPLLAGILIASARPALWARGLYVGALSPALILPLSLAEWLPEPEGLFKAEFQRALGIAFATLTASGTWLHLRLRKQRAVPPHAAAPAEKQASEKQEREHTQPGA